MEYAYFASGVLVTAVLAFVMARIAHKVDYRFRELERSSYNYLDGDSALQTRIITLEDKLEDKGCCDMLGGIGGRGIGRDKK